MSTCFEVCPIVESRDGVHGRLISSYIYGHFTYAIVMMNGIEIIDALSFAYYNLIKVQCFYAKIINFDISLLLTKCILLEVGQVYTHIG